MMMINQLDMKDSNSCRSETTRIDYLIIKENHRETHIRKKKSIYIQICAYRSELTYFDKRYIYTMHGRSLPLRRKVMSDDKFFASTYRIYTDV